MYIWKWQAFEISKMYKVPIRACDEQLVQNRQIQSIRD